MKRRTTTTGTGAWPVIMLTLLFTCLAQLPAVGTAADGGSPMVEATSLDGRGLVRPELSEATRQAFEEKLAAARLAYDGEPTAENLIWYGRRMAYLGRYTSSIELYTRGIERFPDDPRFLRHRGHRWISKRELDRAVDDLARAAEMIQGTADQVEPDGLPNARGIPTSTLHTNIHYHLGLAHYLRGDNEAALAAWERCLTASANPDMEAATRYWLYQAQTRLGQGGAAAENLAAVDADWDIIENHAYHRLLLLYRGDLSLDAVRAGDNDALQNATLAYGIVRWHEVEGRPKDARRVRDALLATDQWAAFGYIAAEADAVRSGANQPLPSQGGN